MAKSPSYFALRRTGSSLGVLHDELADRGREAADVEVAVATMDGLDGQLAGDGDHEGLLLTMRAKAPGNGACADQNDSAAANAGASAVVSSFGGGAGRLLPGLAAQRARLDVTGISRARSSASVGFGLGLVNELAVDLDPTDEQQAGLEAHPCSPARFPGVGKGVGPQVARGGSRSSPSSRRRPPECSGAPGAALPDPDTRVSKRTYGDIIAGTI